jgi:hypothetical protein
MGGEENAEGDLFMHMVSGAFNEVLQLIYG